MHTEYTGDFGQAVLLGFYMRYHKNAGEKCLKLYNCLAFWLTQLLKYLFFIL
jgi:hypothetical protein